MTTGKNAEFKYRVFLSYSHADSKWARWLHKSLESYRVPGHLSREPGQTALPDRIAPVFRDREELPSAASLSDAVNAALSDSESLVVICSPAARKSRWVNEEIKTFKRLGRGARIFCFVVNGEPNSGDDSECFPEALRYDPDGVTRLEPLAADARKQGDGKAAARLKLIAGLLGLGYDDLRQRDLQRRNKRMAAVTVGSLLIAVATIGLAISAMLANAEADRRRAQDEDLIGFMLGDLREGLHEIGRLDIYMRVGDKAMDYFASMADEDVDDEMLNQRSEALRQIGEARLYQGKTELALESFQESLMISRKLAERDPLNSEWQIALANAQFYVGWVHWQRDDLDEARAAFEKVIPIVDAVSAREPDNLDWLAERSYAYTNLGRIHELQGETEAALERYEEVRKINDQLVELDPENPDYRLEVGFAHNNLGKLVESLGRLDEAETHYREDLQIKRDVSASKPNNNLWRGYQATSERFMARILSALGKKEEARLHYSASLTILGELLLVDPERSDLQDQTAITSLELAGLERRGGDISEATQLAENAVEIFESLLSVDASVANWQRGKARCQTERARSAMAQGDVEAANPLLQSANTALSALLENEPSNITTSYMLADTLLAQGDLANLMQTPDTALEHWSAGLTLLETVSLANPSNQQLDLQSELLARTGRNAEAEAIKADLEKMGYQSEY